MLNPPSMEELSVQLSVTDFSERVPPTVCRPDGAAIGGTVSVTTFEDGEYMIGLEPET